MDRYSGVVSGVSYRAEVVMIAGVVWLERKDTEDGINEILDAGADAPTDVPLDIN